MKISIITTTWNNAKYIIDCINSVKNQQLAPCSDEIEIEHIIYDDGSTDGTKDLVEPLVNKNLKYIYSEKNMGPGYGRNFAISKSKGDWIFVLDADDILLPRSIHNFVKGMKENPDYNIYTSDYISVGGNLDYLKDMEQHYAWQFDNLKDEIIAYLRAEHALIHFCMFNREAFAQVGGYDEALPRLQDIDLFFRVLLLGKISFHLCFYSYLRRFRETNWSHGGNDAYGLQVWQNLYLNNIDKVEKLGIKKSDVWKEKIK